MSLGKLALRQTGSFISTNPPGSLFGSGVRSALPRRRKIFHPPTLPGPIIASLHAPRRTLTLHCNLSSITRLKRLGVSFEERVSLGQIVEKAPGEDRPSPLSISASRSFDEHRKSWLTLHQKRLSSTKRRMDSGNNLARGNEKSRSPQVLKFRPNLDRPSRRRRR